MKIFYRITVSLMYVFFKIFYKHKIYGALHFFPGKAIIAPNHASFFDPPIIGASAPEEVSFLAKGSLFEHPFFSFLITNLNAFPVTGTAQELHAFKVICKLLDENKKVVIFPEGNRTFDGNMGTIKQGVAMLALRNHAPIIPTYIAGTFEAWNRDNSYPKFFGHTACVFGSAIDPKDFAHLSKKEAQEALTEKLTQSLTQLREWYEQGAQGIPP